MVATARNHHNMRRTILIVALSTVFVAGTWVWCVFQVIPRGLPIRSYVAYFLWSYNHGYFYSPERSNRIRIVVNDAGALHSGRHCMWIIAHSWVTGDAIIAEGYIANHKDILDGKIPVTWISETEIELECFAARHGPEKVSNRVRLD